MIRIDRVGSELPDGIALLRAAAREEGFRSIERLLGEWASGATRFERKGEALLGAWVRGALAGVGGLTRDPVVPGVLRMRRFYVHPSFRRKGVGRALAVALLEGPIHSRRVVTVNTATPDASAFWEALGFVPDPRDGHTHVLRYADEP